MGKYIFIYFFLGFTGWALETVQESIVRGKFVNKGFFAGPWVPVHGIGGFAVYFLLNPLRDHPALVFFAGAALCTAIEYAAALFLEKFFNVQCWDYRTYPHTKWCHFQGRVCLTISLFFGIIALFVVYVYWDFMTNFAGFFGKYLFTVDIIFIAAFTADCIFSCSAILRAKKTGAKIKGYAVFSGIKDME